MPKTVSNDFRPLPSLATVGPSMASMVQLTGFPSRVIAPSVGTSESEDSAA